MIKGLLFWGNQGELEEVVNPGRDEKIEAYCIPSTKSSGEGQRGEASYRENNGNAQK